MFIDQENGRTWQWCTTIKAGQYLPSIILLE